ncbi:hypothetical protein TYRP_023056, partial [Tyrophagus putrescentiae]
LTDVIWLIGIDRRLGTQLASSLCPEPSVPINQMTPAFNIWSLLGWLHDWCHLVIGIVRRLGTQLASSLCPKPSVPINQMTPAFNIWGLFVKYL